MDPSVPFFFFFFWPFIQSTQIPCRLYLHNHPASNNFSITVTTVVQEANRVHAIISTLLTYPLLYPCFCRVAQPSSQPSALHTGGRVPLCGFTARQHPHWLSSHSEYKSKFLLTDFFPASFCTCLTSSSSLYSCDALRSSAFCLLLRQQACPDHWALTCSSLSLDGFFFFFLPEISLGPHSLSPASFLLSIDNFSLCPARLRRKDKSGTRSK